MKLAFSTLGCPGWSFEEIFATAKDLGLNGIEIRGIGSEMYAPKAKPFCGDAIEHTTAKFAKAGMEISMLTSGCSVGFKDKKDETLKEAKDYIDLAQKMGVKYVRIMIIPVPQPTNDYDMETAVSLYNEICRYGEGKNVTPLIETNGPLASSKVMAEFLSKIESENKGVLWDIHHPYRYFNETPAETYANIGESVKYVHVKDSAMNHGAVNYRMMGYGDVPIFDTLKILSDNGYEGFVTLEWVKRWCPDLQEPGIVFSHFANYMNYLIKQL